MMPAPVRSLAGTFTFVARNLSRARRLPPLPAAAFGPFVVEPLDGATREAAIAFYALLNDGRRLGFAQRLLLRLLGSRLCLIARDVGRNDIVGIAIYYFNAADKRPGTVHAGYSGVAERVRRIGLGTFIRRHALAHFAGAGLAGVSSRVSAGNIASMKTNLKLGFIPVGIPPEPAMKEYVHYLVCDLDAYRAAHRNEKRTACR